MLFISIIMLFKHTVLNYKKKLRIITKLFLSNLFYLLVQNQSIEDKIKQSKTKEKHKYMLSSGC